MAASLLEKHALWIVFLAILLLNAPHLDDPPYWDGAIGVSTQGAWLAEHELDSVALAHARPFAERGPRRDLLSGQAALTAFLMRVGGRRVAFVVLHVLTALWAAVAVTLAAAGFRRASLRWPWLWALAGLAHPIFSGQTASTYIEIPAGACIMGCLHLNSLGRPRGAALVAALMLVVKDSAALLAAALATWLILRCALRVRGEPKLSLSACIALAAPLGLAVALSLLQPTYGGLETRGIIGRLVTQQAMFSPALGLGAIATVIGASLVFISPRTAARAWQDRPLFWETALLATLTWGYWAAVALYPLALPRYHALIIFPQLLLTGRLASLLAPRRAHWLPALLLPLFLANQWGALLPELPPLRQRSGESLERSREWLQDLDATRELCATIAAKPPEVTVVVDWPFTHLLTLPALGYVDAAVPNVASFRPPTWGPCRDVTREDLAAPETLILFVPTLFDTHYISLAPTEASELVHVQRSVNGIAVLFRGLPPERRPPALR